MDDQIRYAFCIEMANLAKTNGRDKAVDIWYGRAWTILLKDTEYENSGAWRAFWEISREDTQ